VQWPREPKSKATPAWRRPQDAPGRCHVCGAKVVVKSPGEVVIKNAILRVDQSSGRVAAKCCRCKAWVAVPLTFTG